MSFTSLLIDLFTPQVATETTDGQGGYTNSWVSGTDFYGRLSGLSISESMSQDKETAFATHRLFCQTGVDLDPDDRILFGSRVLEVVGVQEPSNSNASDHLEILVREIDYDL
ncbi:unnamed protein product [marine sediment metagenome]|uniref:Uncharacterized protein n=1 Tax=marine sediment metagenome TaxID=412755 RepID=X0YME0_9ZZZZ